jgi:hypothetical protein
MYVSLPTYPGENSCMISNYKLTDGIYKLKSTKMSFWIVTRKTN